jgi:hypothetical protein
MSVTYDPATHPLDLPQLTAELIAAGVPVPHGLGTHSGVLFGYDAAGARVDLPPNAQAVVDAHVSQTAARQTQYTTDKAALRTAYQNRLTAIGNGKTLLFDGNDAGWAALTTAQQLTRLRTVLLGQLDFDADVLKALRALVD